MTQGTLADYFTGVAAKRLREVEVNPGTSNQHEFNGVSALRRILGEPPVKKSFLARILYLSDSDDEALIEDCTLTWYDARRRKLDKRGPEWRLYFPTSSVSSRAASGDLLVIGRRPDDSLLVLIAENGSSIANQLLWLFGLGNLLLTGFSVRSDLDTDQDRLSYASRMILDNIGVEVAVKEEPLLETVLQAFGAKFPPTADFSALARKHVEGTDVQTDPDTALLMWMEREELLFRALEKHLVAERLAEGFENDVDGFIEFSLKVQNRRKSRAGLALENHLGAILLERGIRHRRSARTEGESRPDFLFPGEAEYNDPTFCNSRLTMLGAKSSCKDRWRQVLVEAERVTWKHLLTLETAISPNQTTEMNAHCLQLVVPRGLHTTYTPAQQDWLMSLQEFCELVAARQAV